MIFGTADLPENFLYFYIAHFAGGGVVLDRRLRHGPSRNAGALGSIRCPGGRQVLDVASVSVLETALGRSLPPGITAGMYPRDPARWLDKSRGHYCPMRRWGGGSSGPAAGGDRWRDAARPARCAGCGDCGADGQDAPSRHHLLAPRPARLGRRARLHWGPPPCRWTKDFCPAAFSAP